MTANTTTPEPMPELLPCPFCGASGTIIEFEGRTISGHYQAQAGCGECSEVFASVGWGRTQNEANESTAAFWNQRPDLSRPAVGAYNWRDSDARIKRVMEAFGFPDSNSLYSLLKQMENEIHHLLASPQPPAEDLRKALADFSYIAARAKPNCGDKLRALIQVAQETHADLLKKLGA